MVVVVVVVDLSFSIHHWQSSHAILHIKGKRPMTKDLTPFVNQDGVYLLQFCCSSSFMFFSG
jgi:hypothetical protein